MSDAMTAVCGVCPHECRIGAGKMGLCGARGNEDGRIVSLNFGQCTALALDPIEKKPLARFHPGSKVLSYGSFGCNLRCRFCQNSDISMADAEGPAAARATYVAPERLAEEAGALRDRGNIGIALTYNEPLISPEFLKDVGALMHERGMHLVAVTNGYVTHKTFEALLPFIDAANIDLKCFSEEGYASVGAPGGLEAVTGNIERAADSGMHVEVTTLVVPGLSDNEEQFRREVDWLASVDPRIPLHLSRFFPQYKMLDKHPTDVSLLRKFAEIAGAKLDYVYLGNV